MKRQIVLEHRQALDEMEEARLIHITCKRKGQCDEGRNCVICPAALNHEAKKAVFDEKAAALNKLNEQIIDQQHNKAIIKVHERTKERSEKMMKSSGNQLYKREELTVERYKKHREVDELNNREIREMYGYPASSFEQWKRNNNLTNPDKYHRAAKVVTEQAATSEEEQVYKSQYEQVKTEYDDLLEKHLKLQQELAAVKTDSAEKLEEMTALKTELNRLEEVNIGLRTERDVFEAEGNQYKQQVASQLETIERLQADIATLIEDADNDTMEAIQRQFQRFDQWETFILERLLQLKKAN